MRGAQHAGMDTPLLQTGLHAHALPDLAHGLPARQRPQNQAAEAPQLVATWAMHGDEVREAQRLRHRVFAGEMDAQLKPLPGSPPGHDIDHFDDHCEHLLVRTVETASAPARVVGTYRVLTPVAARRAGGLYSDQEFDLGTLDPLRHRIAELGRSCTDPAFRNGGVILMLWAALADFMGRNGLDVSMGCASISMHDGGHAAADLWHQLRDTHLAPAPYTAVPRLPLPVDQLRTRHPADAPPLIKGYLRCGGKVLGAPAWDPDFRTADLPMMIQLADLPAAYRRRFIRA